VMTLVVYQNPSQFVNRLCVRPAAGCTDWLAAVSACRLEHLSEGITAASVQFRPALPDCAKEPISLCALAHPYKVVEPLVSQSNHLRTDSFQL